MTNQPPFGLIQQWAYEKVYDEHDWLYEIHIANSAAQWAANEELEACCAWLPDLPPWSADDLRRHRRPKPPSLKEQAYAALDTYIYGEPDPKDKERTYNTIRKALETLND